MSGGADGAIEELEVRLSRYPEHRYPVQHATTQFHRGGALIEMGRLAEAEGALRSSIRLFEGLRHEQAKALNLLGVALRAAGRLHEAAEAFEQARERFEAEEQPVDGAAASFNLGLVQAQAGDSEAAQRSLSQARRRFDELGAPASAGAAARELGAVLLASGEAEASIEVLEEAVTAGDRAGDPAGRGAAANALGLARLAAGRAGQATDALREAVAAHPRSVRPEGYAMAKANLALAYEAAGDEPRARLAARQALGSPGAAKPVRLQAAAVLERLGQPRDDLMVVLDQEAGGRLLPLVREEVLRWVDAPPTMRRAEAAAWIDGQLARPARAMDLAEAWLGVLLELPPPAMEDLVRTTLEALADHDGDVRQRFCTQVSRAMGCFNVPQWMRLKDTFARTAQDLGQREPWG